MKAILVINEMPTKCEGCPLHYRKRQDIYRCEMTHKNIRLNNKPSWCPLKPLPQMKWHEEGKENECEEWFKNGWNACLEEIEE